MNPKFEIIQPGTGNYEELLEYLKEIDHTHIPSISSRVNLSEWTRKLVDNATLFIYRDAGKIVACVADYVKAAPNLSFATHLSCKAQYADFLLGPQLIRKAIKYEKEYGSSGRIGKVRGSYKALLKFLTGLGFEVIGRSTFPNSNEEELELKLIFK